MKLTGLTAAEVEASRNKYGSNKLTQIEPDPLWKRIIEGFRDPMILILLVALVIQMVLYFLGQAEWFEPVGILVAVLIANGVAAVSEHEQQGKAAILRKDEDAKDNTKVIRDGHLKEILVSEIVTGDLVFLQAGDRIPADGVLVEGTLQIDQSVLNGETEEIAKQPLPDGQSYDINDLLNPYYIYRGTVVCDNQAYLEVKVVGDATFFGKLALEAQEEQRETPLQVKLHKLADQISQFGYAGAAAIVIGILAKTFISGNLPADFYAWLRLIIDAVTVAVTIIVCAVPEGLPMLTSILLSYQSLRMEKDNVLVKKINGIETSGSLSLLFSDKTGTITEGRLSVADFVTGGQESIADLATLDAALQEEIIRGIGLNNGARCSSEGEIIGGNSTDRALLGFLQQAGKAEGLAYEKITDVTTFNSKDKFASVTMNDNGAGMIYIKGAPEVLLPRCKTYLDSKAEVQPLPDHTAMNAYLDEQAGRAMRLLTVARTTGNMDELELIGILSIRDNVRASSVEAIRQVQGAGVQVVMVTGDRRETALAIAKEAGLITAATDVVLTSAELNSKSDEEIKKIIPQLRVVARALPTDKSRLVRLAQELDYVVGMTGDGVNDSPALKKADVGFAMGSGTEVAKEAGDITILDDNFSSIAKAILYGRTMFKSIRKFLIFQLTVNVAAVLICFLAPFFGENVVLTVIQLLLINLAMDTLAAIAFASEPALPEFMQDKPVPRRESIITGRMLAEVILGSFYITAICLAVLFCPFVSSFFGAADTVYLKSALFAVFMMAITCNGFNARTEHLNVFENLGRNRNFLLVMLAIFAIQFVFVEFGGEVLSVEPLTPHSWAVCFGLAFLVIPLDIVRKLLSK